MIKTAMAAQRIQSFTALLAESSMNTRYTGMRTMRTRVILLAVVMIIFLQNTD